MCVWLGVGVGGGGGGGVCVVVGRGRAGGRGGEEGCWWRCGVCGRVGEWWGVRGGNGWERRGRGGEVRGEG